MANALYDAGRKAFLDGNIDFVNDTIKIILIDTADYTVNLATHEDLADVPSAARVATVALSSGKTSTAGVADADDVQFPTVSGDASEAIVMYKDTGVEGTSTLIAYWDDFFSGMPVTPDGGNINVQFDSGTDKIFKL